MTSSLELTSCRENHIQSQIFYIWKLKHFVRLRIMWGFVATDLHQMEILINSHVVDGEVIQMSSTGFSYFFFQTVASREAFLRLIQSIYGKLTMIEFRFSCPGWDLNFQHKFYPPLTGPAPYQLRHRSTYSTENRNVYKQFSYYVIRF